MYFNLNDPTSLIAQDLSELKKGGNSVDAQARADIAEANSKIEDLQSDFDTNTPQLLETMKKTDNIVSLSSYPRLVAETDDTPRFNRAIAAVPSNGTLKVDDGEYLIDPTTDSVNSIGGIKLKSNMVLLLAKNTILRAKPVSADRYNVVSLYDIENVAILGGVIQGERTTHTGTTGEWGFGISIRGCKNVNVTQTTIKDCWGDGIYIGGGSSYTTCENVTVRGVVCDNNRRQGISVVALKKGLIVESTCSNTNGTAPAAGIDLEPNNGEVVENVTLLNNFFLNNAGDGILVSRRTDLAGLAFTDRNIIQGNVCSGNGANGINLSNTNECVVSSNVVKNNNIGIYIGNSKNNNVSLNVATDNINQGVYLSSANGNIVTGNNVARNGNHGLQIYQSSYNSISNNSVRENKRNGITVAVGSANNSVINNSVEANSQETTNTYDNIRVYSDADYNNIQGNTARKGTLTNTPRAGISIEDSTSSYNLVINNDTYAGGSTYGINNTASNTQFGAGNRVLNGTWNVAAS